MKEEEVAKLKVVELKEELKNRGLAVSGLKAELAKRLLEAVQQEGQEKEPEVAEDATNKKEEPAKASGVDAEEPKQEIEAPKSDGNAALSNEASAAAPKPTGNEDSTKQSKREKSAAAEPQTKAPKGKQEELKDEGPKAQPASDKLDDKPDELTEAPKVEKTTTTAGNASSLPKSTDSTPAAALNGQDKPGAPEVGKTAQKAQEVPSDTPAAKRLAEDSVPATSKTKKAKQEEKPKETAVQDTAAPQAIACESAAPQVDILGSVQVAAPLQETAEEEVDYEADEVMDQASAPATTKAEGRKEEGSGKKRPADREGPCSSKAQKTDDLQKRREPIAFKPRGSTGSESGRLAENGQREPSGDLRRTGSQNEKRSVFERLHSGAGKEATTPRRAPPSREAATRALFISGFVRPFTESQARAMLSETGGIEGFWMPKIKDRAYIVYTTEEGAEATRNAVSGIEWPVGNGNSLRPKYVSLEDAERTIKTGQPPEMRMEVSATATAPQPARAAVGAAEAARAAPARPAAPAQNGAPAETARPKDMREILEERRRAREGRQGPAAAPAQRRPSPAAAAQPAPEPMEEEQEEEPKALEDLFRKTETKPWLYWLPLTEEQAAEKAARDSAQLPGPPSRPVQS